MCGFPTVIALASVLALAISVPAIAEDEPPEPTCDSIDSCIALAAKSTACCGIEENVAAEYLSSLPGSPELRDALFAILESGHEPSEWVGAMALYRHAQPGDVPRLIALMQRGVWVESMLGKFGTTEALDAIVAHVEADPEKHFSSARYLDDFGDRARSAALRWLVQIEPPSRRLNELGMEALRDNYAEEALDAVAIELGRLVGDAKAPPAQRLLAFHALFDHTPPTAAIFTDELHRVLEEPHGELRELVAQRLGESGDDGALGALVDALASSPEQALESIAALQARGRSAGPDVARLLDHADARIRSQALATLHEIGYDARPQVMRLAASSDPVLAAAAMLWLRRHAAGDEVAAAELAALATSYWFPPTREIAGGKRDAVAYDRCREESCGIFTDGTNASMYPACPGAVAAAGWVSQVPTVTASEEQLASVKRSIGKEPYHITSALRLSDGWLLGHVRGGGMFFVPDAGEDNDPEDWRGGGVSYLFTYRGRHYAIAEANDVSLGGTGLFEVDVQDGAFSFRTVMLLPDRPDDVRSDGTSHLLLMSETAGVLDLSDVERPNWLGCVAGP